MKQKLAIVLALMNDPEILFFDEPTTGLDPLMRDSFMNIVKSEHQKGKTILMSSHMFEELEDYSDKVGLIVNGKMLDIADMKTLRSVDWKLYKVEFTNKANFEAFLYSKFEIIRKQEEYNQVTVKVKNVQIKEFLNELSKYNVKFFREVDYNLEKYFKEVLENRGGK